MTRDQSSSLDESLLRVEKTEEEAKCEERDKSSVSTAALQHCSTAIVSTEWSPLQLSSYNLTKPSVRPRPPLRTETLERHLPRPALRTFTSGRSSAEPLETARLALSGSGRTDRDLVTPLPTSLSELDLR